MTRREGTDDPPPPKPWHALTADEALRRLESSPHGLSEAEAQRRLEAHGPNLLPAPRTAGPLLRFARQFHNVLIYVLLAAAAVTASLGHWVDTGVILGAVLMNAAIGFVQEGKAQRAMESVRDMLALQAIVLREGRRRTVDAAGLVPGDVVALQPGDKVPADLRLIRAKGLRAVEAALTGESVPVDKSSEAAAPAVPLGEQASMAFAGTSIAAGQATGVVAATGLATRIGHVSRLLAETDVLTTPLVRRLAAMGRWLTAAILTVAAATFAVGTFLRSLPADEMFMAAVGLAVAAIPEGLPAIITIALAIGVERMARRNAIIRRLPAVETLGSVTVICSDKTGTLTRNELTVRALVTACAAYEVAGTGYAPHGAIACPGPAGADPALPAMLLAASLCNDAELREHPGEWRLVGDPTEGALLSAAMKGGVNPRSEAVAHPRLDEIPFDAAHRFMATLNRDGDAGVIFLKGAPEAVLAVAARELAAAGPRPIDGDFWHRAIADAASAGRRVLAVASKHAPFAKRRLAPGDVRDGFTLLGLFAMIDPPREEAIAAVADCRRAGIQVKMITGDHLATAAAIGRELGIDGKGALTGHHIDRLDDAALGAAVRATAVFARADPAHKLRQDKALQAGGHVVAMTGDGVNDAPALKRADVGVAMGRKGTEAAKEASVMVLADDNFATIAHAVREGRAVYDNLRKTLMFLLPTDLGEALLVVTAVLMGMALPVSPVQILWINLVTSVTLGLALVFEPAEEDVMRRPPRPPGETLLSGLVLWRIAFIGALMLALTFWLFHRTLDAGGSLELARTVAVNGLVACEAFYLIPARFIFASGVSPRALKGLGPALLTVSLTGLVQMAFTYLPPMQALFHTAGLGVDEWMAVMAAGLLLLLAAEIEKFALRRLMAGRRLARAAINGRLRPPSRPST
ncbi:MAG: HAD-IC family P-type ATPase [Rhodospirillales bacterium]